MINTIDQNFGIDELKIEGFKRINIFVGENGIGKTSILKKISFLPKAVFLNVKNSDKSNLSNFLQEKKLDSHQIILMDEIENGLHIDNHPKLWQSVLTSLKANPEQQFFAATHSKEMVKALWETAKNENMENEIILFRITRHTRGELKNKLIAVSYDTEELEYSMLYNGEFR